MIQLHGISEAGVFQEKILYTANHAHSAACELFHDLVV